MMGESHGDMFGMEYVNSNGFVPVAGENRYARRRVCHRQPIPRDPQLRDNMPTSGGSPQPSKQLFVTR